MENTNDITAKRDQTYKVMCEFLQKRGAEAQKRINAHVREVVGRSVALPNYHCDESVSDDDKVALYIECGRALVKQDYSALKGQVGAGDKRVIETTTTATIESAVEKEKEKAPQSTTTAAPETTTRRNLPVQPVDVKDDDASNLAALIQRLAAGVVAQPAANEPQEFPEDRVKELALEVVKHAMTNGEFPEDRVKTIVEEAIKAAMSERPAGQLLTITSPEATREVHGTAHWQLPQIVTWVNANVPIWLWGQAGGGKTHMGRQVAEALGLTATIISIDPTMTVGKLLGYRNLANGEFVPGFLLQPYRDGGLAMLDEIDTGDPGILAALNALLANDYYLFPNGETIKRHDKFRVIAGANTKGCGAVAGYTARNRLDAATLDRFAVIELQYDPGLERALALGVSKPAGTGKTWSATTLDSSEVSHKCGVWVDWVQNVRSKVGNSVLVSPRASILGVKAIRANIPIAEVADALVFKLVTSDTLQSITNQCGRVS